MARITCGHQQSIVILGNIVCVKNKTEEMDLDMKFLLKEKGGVEDI